MIFLFLFFLKTGILSVRRRENIVDAGLSIDQLQTGATSVWLGIV